MTLVREPGSQILTQFGVPTRGTWLSTAVHDVPINAVYKSSNVFVREGKLRTRPGLEQFPPNLTISSTPTRHIIGGSLTVITTVRSIYVVSVDTLFVFTDNAIPTWATVPIVVGTPIANSNTETVDITFLPSSGSIVAVFANRDYPLKQWIIGEPNIHSITGTNIPNANSVCTAASRIIAFVQPHTIVWSKTNTYNDFDALAIVIRAQTTDAGVCVRSLSALSFVFYKEHSIHVARAQAGLDEGTAFAFSEPIIAEGPAGVYAIVDVEGTHIYMTRSGRIGLFDGTNRPQWIADGIWLFLQEDIDQTYARLIRAVYDYRLNTIVFFYPKVGETSSMTGMVIINLPLKGFEIEATLLPYCFLAQCGKAVTHACSRRSFNEVERAIVFTIPGALGVSHIYSLSENAINDDGVNFTCSFQTGLQSTPDARHTQTAIESFLERASGYGTVSIAPVTSNSLESKGGTIHTGDAQVIDLTVEPVNEYIGFHKTSRFFGFQYTWTSTSKVFYSGTVVYDSVIRRQR